MASALSSCWAVFVLGLILSSVTGQNLFADDLGIEDQSMVMTCDLRRSGYTGNVADVGGVNSLTVSKFENNQDEVLVIYGVPPPTGTSDNTVVNNLPASSYDVVTEGLYPVTDGNIEGNQNGMKIVIRFLSLTCGNQGIYKCKATCYVGSQVLTHERPENLTIDAMPQWKTNNLDNPLNAKPFEQNYRYKENANVTFRCWASGPSNMVIRWRYQLCEDPNRNPALGCQTPIIENWFPSSDVIEEETGSGSSDSCGGLELESKLGDDVDGARIQLNKVGRSADGLLCFLQCQVGYMERNIFRELIQRNTTFQYDDPVTGQDLDLFPDSVKGEGQSTTLTCDLQRSGYTGRLGDVAGVISLTVSMFDPQSNTFVEKVHYADPHFCGTNHLDNLLPIGRYDVVAEGLYPDGQTIQDNQEKMNIEIRFNSLTFRDQGTYKCESRYLPRGRLQPVALERTQPLTIRER